VLKKSVIVASQEDDAPRNDPVSLAWTAAGVLWEATERADLRGWSLLPGQIQVLRVDLQAGTHRLRLAPLSMGRQAGPPVESEITVRDGMPVFTLAVFPDAGTAGKAFSSQ
jgi:hypothetical protein